MSSSPLASSLSRWNFTILVFFALSTSRSARCGDWPQVLGPLRNGHAQGEELAAWPSAGPKQLWSYNLGSGYAGPAVAGNRLIVFHRVSNKERVEALDATTGKPQWKFESDALYRGGYNPDSGPRCVPLIDGDRVFVFGAAGELTCLELNTGKKLWSHSTFQEFQASEGYFGVGSTPIVISGRLIANIGGRAGAGLVAFNVADGSVAWKSTNDDASYSSPTQFMVGNEPHALFVARLNVFCVHPADGKIAFQLPFGMRGPTVNAATPIVLEGQKFFLTASYGIGANLVSYSGTSAASIWANDDSLSSQYTTPIHHQGYIYGTHGREDAGAAAFRCIEAKTGKVLWSVDDLGVAHAILVGDKLLVLTTGGQLVLAAASPKEFKKLAMAQVSTNATKALPALARGRFYFRDTGNTGGTLKCLQLR